MSLQLTVENARLCNKKLIPHNLYLSAPHKFTKSCCITSKVQRCLLGIQLYYTSTVLNKFQKAGQAGIQRTCTHAGFRIPGRPGPRDCGTGPSSWMLAVKGMSPHGQGTETQDGERERLIHIYTVAKLRWGHGSPDHRSYLPSPFRDPAPLL